MEKTKVFTPEEEKQIDDWLKENSDLMDRLVELEEKEKIQNEK